MGKGVKTDVVLAIAIVGVLGAAVGAILGYSANRFGLSNGTRLIIMVGFVALAGRLAQAIVARRAKARAARPETT